MAALGFLDDSFPAWKIEVSHPSPAPSSLHHSVVSFSPPTLAQVGDLGTLTTDWNHWSDEGLKMHMGAPKTCSWRHIWKTGTTGMPDVHAGVRQLIFLANNQRSLPCGFKKKKKGELDKSVETVNMFSSSLGLTSEDYAENGCRWWMEIRSRLRRLIKSPESLLISLRSRVTDDRTSHLKDHQNEA